MSEGAAEELELCRARAEELEQHISNLERVLTNVRKERDAAATQVQEWGKRWSAEESRAVRAEQERDAALADNAAKNIALRVILKTLGKSVVTGEDVHKARKYAAGSLSSPHPGAAQLEEHRKELVRARNEGLEKAATKVREMGRIFRAEAAQRSDASGDAWLMAASGAADIGNAIDALKEPEGGQS